jgi:hypothetical protein
MDSYDVFEILADGTPLWKCCVNGRDAALQKMESLAATCEHEFRVIHLPSSVTVARIAAKAKP